MTIAAPEPAGGRPRGRSLLLRGCGLLAATLLLALPGGSGAGQQVPASVRERVTLDNGLTLIALPRLDSDPDTLVALEFTVRAGSALEPAGLEGLTGILAGVLQSEIRENVALDGGEAGSTLVWAEPDRLAIRILTNPARALSHVARTLDVLSAPLLAGELIARQGEQAAAALAGQLLEPESMGARVFVREIFAGHPYGTAETPFGLTGIPRDSLVAFHGRTVAPARTLVVVAGLDRRGLAALQESLAGWPVGAPAPVVPLPEVSAPTPGSPGEHDVQVVHVPGADRVTIQVGQGLPPVDEAEWTALALGVELQAIANARAFAGWGRFRADMGHIPSDASVTRFQAGGLLRLRAMVPPAEVERGLLLLLESLQLAGRTIPSPDQMEAVVGQLRQATPTHAPLEARVARVAAYESVGLGPAFWAEFEARLDELDGFVVRDALAERIVPSGATVVVVGDATRFGEALEGFGTVQYRDSRGEPVSGPDETALVVTPLPAIGPPAFGAWEYRVLVGGRDVGRSRREVAPGPDSLPGSLTIRSSLSLGEVEQRSEVVVRGTDLEALGTHLESAGAGTEIETNLSVRDARVRGVVRDRQRGFEQQISAPAPPGLLAGDALEVALWVTPLAEGASWSVPFLDPAGGQVGTAQIVVLGLMDVELSSGPTSAWAVDVVARGLRQRLHLSSDSPRVTLAAELVGQPLRLELIRDPEEDGS